MRFVFIKNLFLLNQYLWNQNLDNNNAEDPNNPDNFIYKERGYVTSNKDGMVKINGVLQTQIGDMGIFNKAEQKLMGLVYSVWRGEAKIINFEQQKQKQITIGSSFWIFREHNYDKIKNLPLPRILVGVRYGYVIANYGGILEIGNLQPLITLRNVPYESIQVGDVGIFRGDDDDGLRGLVYQVKAGIVKIVMYGGYEKSKQIKSGGCIIEFGRATEEGWFFGNILDMDVKSKK